MEKQKNTYECQDKAAYYEQARCRMEARLKKVRGEKTDSPAMIRTAQTKEYILNA